MHVLPDLARTAGSARRWRHGGEERDDIERGSVKAITRVHGSYDVKL